MTGDPDDVPQEAADHAEAIARDVMNRIRAGEEIPGTHRFVRVGGKLLETTPPPEKGPLPVGTVLIIEEPEGQTGARG